MHVSERDSIVHAGNVSVSPTLNAAWQSDVFIGILMSSSHYQVTATFVSFWISYITYIGAVERLADPPIKLPAPDAVQFISDAQVSSILHTPLPIPKLHC